jgi:hypothetical protein
MAEFYIAGNASLGELAYKGEAAITATLDWVEVDRGIGSYEYHGSKDVNEDWTHELEEVCITSAVLWDDVKGEDVEIDLTHPENKPLIEFWEEYIFENAEHE